MPKALQARSRTLDGAGAEIRLFLVVALAVSSLATRGARAGPEIGLRGAYTIPFGEIVQNVNVADSFSGGIPLQVDLGYRFTPAFYAGIYGSYAFLFAAECGSANGCSQHGWPAGLDLLFHPAPQDPVDLWVGIGAGYEWLSFSESKERSGRRRRFAASSSSTSSSARTSP